MNIMQFKRVYSTLGFKDTLKKVSEQNLKYGEPMLCAYQEADGSERWFLAVGTKNSSGSSYKMYPIFSDYEDFVSFISKKLNIEIELDLKNVISADSDVEIADELGSDGKQVLKLKDALGVEWTHLD